MADKRISDFPAASSLSGTELIEVVQGGLNKKATASQLMGGGGAVDSVNGETGVVVLDKTDIGLPNVDNTSDANKPVSTAQATAISTAVSGRLLNTNNLSDVSNAATARTNLGLGTLATQSGTFSGTSSGTNTGDQTLTSLLPTQTGNSGKVLQTDGTNATWQTPSGAGDSLISEGALINSATAKTTPVDADFVGLMDSAASNILKKVSWANIKATLKTYFDTLYQVAGSYVTLTGTETLTNKRLTARIQTVTSSATVTPNADTDDAVKITAQAAGLTLANPSGTPTGMQAMIIRIKDNGTARTITYGTQYRAIGVTLPTTTVISKTIYLGLIWNADDTKWDVIGYSLEA